MKNKCKISTSEAGIPEWSDVQRGEPTFSKLLFFFWHLLLLRTGNDAKNSVRKLQSRSKEGNSVLGNLLGLAKQRLEIESNKSARLYTSEIPVKKKRETVVTPSIWKYCPQGICSNFMSIYKTTQKVACLNFLFINNEISEKLRSLNISSANFVLNLFIWERLRMATLLISSGEGVLWPRAWNL